MTTTNKDTFIKKSKELFGDNAFDYSLVEYVNGYTDIQLVCKEHGLFTITPNRHLDIVGGCPLCSKVCRKKRSKMTTDEYKRLVIDKHGDKYDLTNTVYKGMKEKVSAICPIHGEFSINAHDFAHKRGCPMCGSKERHNKRTYAKRSSKITNEKFVQLSKVIHKNYYDYSLVDVDKKDDKNRVRIICPIHGEFRQNIHSHLKGYGCPKCGKAAMSNTQMMTTEQFINKAKEIHGDKYDYSRTEYKGCYEKVEIICPKHGVFNQSAYSHLGGHGCPKCATETLSEKLFSNTSDFISKAKEIHGDAYDYSNVEYCGAKVPVSITCQNGHVFYQMPNKHLEGHGCPFCSNIFSKPEHNIADFIESFGLSVVKNSRTIINPYELDLYIPEKKVAIEYDGLIWHSEKYNTDKNYHLNKTTACGKKGIRLIHIFEDEWIYKEEIVKSRLKNILGLTNNKVYARQCTIKEVASKEGKCFLDENHLQGGINSSIRFGLYYNGELVSLMVFGKQRKNLGKNSNDNSYELLRFCNKLNINVVGGASKLFKHFVDTYTPNEVISYADRRWSNGGLYPKLGFVHTHNSQPNYFYIIKQKRHNRFSFRKDILVKQGYDASKSEHEIMLDRQIYRIYDCGTMVFKWSEQ